jgi:hypothetical protein
VAQKAFYQAIYMIIDLRKFTRIYDTIGHMHKQPGYPWYGLANVTPRTNRGVTLFAPPPPAHQRQIVSFIAPLNLGSGSNLIIRKAKYQVKKLIAK